MKNNYFLSQPHQPFFVLAFVNAVIFMIMFMLAYKGVLTFSVDVVNFHAFGLIFLFFTPAFYAFLFTTFPKFLSTPVVSKSLYIKIFALYVLATLLFIVGAIISPIVYKIGMIITVFAFVYAYKALFDIYKKSIVVNKYDAFWILVGASFGIVGATSFIVTPFLNFSIQVSIYLYLFVLAFSVAQRMIPAFSQCRFEKNKNFLKYVVILLATHVALEFLFKNLSFIVDFILAIYVAKELIRWKLPFPNQNPMLSILHIALFWVPLAFLLSAISNGFEFFYDISFLALDIHSLMLGFLLTLLIGFGTRVTLGHSGNTMLANKLTKFIFIWTQVVILVRVITSIVASLGMNFMIIFDISVTFWLILFLVWSWQFLKVLTHGKKLN
jgi:uncharacterized protein involved in response to NO